MSAQLEAIYENGVFRPLQPVQLPDQQRVTISIDTQPEADAATAVQVQFVLSPDRWQAFCDAIEAPPRHLPALKKLLTEASLFDVRV
jgi:predicted DNA-binding antitoxin AbrB/MazE fold protein